MTTPLPFFFFWCKFGFGKCFGASSWTNHWASHSVLPYKIHLLLHITIQLRNDSLLYRIRVDDTSKWQIFRFVVISQGTHLLSFFTSPTYFKCWTTIEWSTLGSSATSCIFVRGSASLIALNCSLSISDDWPFHLYFHVWWKDVWDISTTAMKNPWKNQMISNGERKRGWVSNLIGI